MLPKTATNSSFQSIPTAELRAYGADAAVALDTNADGAVEPEEVRGFAGDAFVVAEALLDAARRAHGTGGAQAKAFALEAYGMGRTLVATRSLLRLSEKSQRAAWNLGSLHLERGNLEAAAELVAPFCVGRGGEASGDIEAHARLGDIRMRQAHALVSAEAPGRIDATVGPDGLAVRSEVLDRLRQVARHHVDLWRALRDPKVTRQWDAAALAAFQQAAVTGILYAVATTKSEAFKIETAAVAPTMRAFLERMVARGRLSPEQAAQRAPAPETPHEAAARPQVAASIAAMRTAGMDDAEIQGAWMAWLFAAQAEADRLIPADLRIAGLEKQP